MAMPIAAAITIITSAMTTFDFDEWATLAKTDPEAFAQRRAAVIEAVIVSAPVERQLRLRGLQWRIDMERQRCKNPMHACIHLFNKMWSSVYSERGLLNAMLMLRNPHSPGITLVGGSNTPSKPSASARGATASAAILPFNRPKAVM